jgi:N6-L-threonylcarbamoyladenine synthase
VRILGIETSCDDTGAAVVEDGRVIAERVVTQQVHRAYRGVVPELASREHLDTLFPLVDEVVGEAGGLDAIDAVAVTCGPGLVGCLLVGLSAAKAIAYGRRIPFVGVNHIHAHARSASIEHDVPMPFLALVVSGGHTELMLVEDEETITLLGTTLDDAAGEAFDKVATLLGLPYPGGVEIDRLATEGNPEFESFPRPLLKRPDFDVSFSGLKTAVRMFVSDHPERDRPGFRADVAASFQRAVVDLLIAKTARALERHDVHALVVAGGVACNSELRARAAALAAQRGIVCAIPAPRHCRDNATMIAWAGERALARGHRSPYALNAYASLEALDEAPLYE